MDDKILRLCQQYYSLFGNMIPNEPSWPNVVTKDPKRFAGLLESSIKEKRDFLTEVYGPGWNELDSEYLY